VRYPVAGTWTGVIFGDVASDGGTNGVVPWRVATERFAPFGSVSPSSVVLSPGQSQTVQVSATAPSSPGDGSGSIVISSSRGGNTSIPVTLRSLVSIQHDVGTFSGVLTGGNGRDPGTGQSQYYEFNVGNGIRDITANVSLTNDAADPAAAYLIAPDGATEGYGQNSLNGKQLLSLTAYTANPVPGRWTLIVVFAEPVVGNELAEPFTGNIEFNNVDVTAKGLPDSTGTELAAGTAVTVPVKITNNGASPEDFFVDPRLNATQWYVLPALAPSSDDVDLPMTGAFPTWFVPTETASISVGETSSLPAMFDLSPFNGDPDVASAGPGSGPLCADSESAFYAPSSGSVTAGLWEAGPTECGPYSGAAPAGTAEMTATALTKTFDTAVTSTTGDLWLASIGSTAAFKPIVIDPGKTATIHVTITPSGTAGTVVQGTLYVDDFTSDVPPPAYGQEAGDELVGLPYSYTIK
jgi:hypothetical protein